MRDTYVCALWDSLGRRMRNYDESNLDSNEEDKPPSRSTFTSVRFFPPRVDQKGKEAMLGPPVWALPCFLGSCMNKNEVIPEISDSPGDVMGLILSQTLKPP